MEGPQRPILPTPIPTANPFSLAEATASNETVFDPVSNVVPGIDPEIDALVNQVSQQQLMGYIQTLENFGTRNSYSVTDLPNFGIGAARAWLATELQRVGNGRLQVETTEFMLNYRGLSIPQQNVIATLPGTEPNSGLIVVMAHYDTRPHDEMDGSSRAPGANDNASGLALLLESARVLSSRQWNQTIVFAAFAAEEQGTFGARHFVQNKLLNGENIIAAFNYDGVGGEAGIPQYIRLFAPDLHYSPHGELARYYDFIGGMYVPTFPINIINAPDREGRWGDQREFVNAGLPALRFTQSVENPDLLNSVRDSWDRIDYNYLQQVTQLNVAVLANMLGAPPQPEPPSIAPMAQPGSFLLTWPVDERADGYAISFRPLDSAQYVPFRFVTAFDAGNVAITDLDPNIPYALSMAPITQSGQVGLFSREVIIPALQ